MDKLNEYVNEYLGHGYLGVATVRDPRFNFNVFGLVFESSREGNAKNDKLKSHFKPCFYQYRDQGNAIKHEKFIQEQG